MTRLGSTVREDAGFNPVRDSIASEKGCAMLRKAISGLVAGCCLVVGMATPAVADAALMTYTFESPNFALFGTTPLNNRAPNVGGSGFLATFSGTTGDPGAFTVINPDPDLNALMIGQILWNAPAPADGLTVTFNQAVDQVLVDFAILTPGSLSLTSSAGGVTVNSAVVGGGNFQGGTLSFSSATPFTSFSLLALSAAGAPAQFAIDNLRVSQVPEPGTLGLLLLGLGLASLGVLRRRRA